ncbi:hypothetical protein WS69_07980 [Burkholderia sp. BDU5]|nr:hypothetical protein WS69_07980 [Burkholderia sp. BDU5]
MLDISDLDATPVQRMPAIMDFDFLPDMGRMSAKYRARVKAGALDLEFVFKSQRITHNDL